MYAAKKAGKDRTTLVAVREGEPPA
jgi:hypothetical protein